MKRLSGTLFGALSNLLAQGVPFLLLLFVTPILIAHLGRATYGALILFNLLPQIAGQLDLGLVTAGTRAYAQYVARDRPHDAHRVITETMVILCTWGGLLAIAFFLWRHSISSMLQLDDLVRDHQSIFAIAAVGIPVALINGVALIPLRAMEQYGTAARIQIVAGLAYWTACSIAATRGATLVQLVGLGTVIVVLTNVALFVVLWRARDARKTGLAREAGIAGPMDAPVVDDLAPVMSPSTLRLRPFLPLGAGAFVAQASSLATYHTDKLLVAAFVSPAAAGAYAICANIANKILLVVAAGATYTFPRAARLHAQGDHDALVRTFVVTTRFVLMIAAALTVPLVTLASPFLRTWIGADFADHYAPVMQLLVIGYAMNAASVVASNVAIGIGDFRLPALFAVLGGATTIVAVLILAPRFGAVGASAAALLGMSQAIVFSNRVAAKLGPAAKPASWGLQGRLVLIAVPIAVVTFYAGAFVRGWLSLVAIGILSTTAFLSVWLSTCGRLSERLVLDALLARLRTKTAPA